MEIYHSVRQTKNSKWTVGETAKDFQVSIGLTSENLRLAEVMHYDKDLINCKTREEALKRIGTLYHKVKLHGRNLETTDD